MTNYKKEQNSSSIVFLKMNVLKKSLRSYDVFTLTEYLPTIIILVCVLSIIE